MSILRSTPFRIITLFVFLLGYIVSWSGQPPSQSQGVFLLGVILLIGVMVLFGLATWHLLWRPLPKGIADVTAKPASNSKLLGALILIAMLNIILGGMWDEVWHREYGLPFGEDLFWRPHILLYTGFGIVVGLSLGSLWLTVRTHKGTLQQKFRRDPAIGMLGMLGGFLIFALPADPVWHIIYGDDITAWSLPHLLLAVITTIMGVLGTSLLLTGNAPRRWRSLFNISWETPIFLIATGGILTIVLIVMLTEWDSGFGDPAGYFRRLGRPDWLLPVMVVGIGSFIGRLTLHTTKQFGSATAAGLLALLVRVLFITTATTPDLTANGWLIALVPLVTMDLLYLFAHKRVNQLPLWMLAIYIIVTLLVIVPFIHQLFVYPTINTPLILPMLGIGLLTGLPLAWVGETIGEFIASHATGAAQMATVNSRFIVPVAFTAVVNFIIFFVLTATPPV